jgi:hypothetical protein
VFGADFCLKPLDETKSELLGNQRLSSKARKFFFISDQDLFLGLSHFTRCLRFSQGQLKVLNDLEEFGWLNK